MSTFDTRWPLPALPIDCGRYYALSIRGALYDLAACVALGRPGADPGLVVTLCRALAGLPPSERTLVLAALSRAGITNTLVAVLIGAVMRAERTRVDHAWRCDPTRARMAFQVFGPVRAGVA